MALKSPKRAHLSVANASPVARMLAREVARAHQNVAAAAARLLVAMEAGDLREVGAIASELAVQAGRLAGFSLLLAAQ